MTDQLENQDQSLPKDPKLSIPVDDVEDVTEEEGQKLRKKGVYLLPNLFTTAALFAGFYSIVSSMYAPVLMAQGHMAQSREYFIYAAIAIFIAMILDGLDGRVARLTNTQSAFGAEYDSLSDMVAFGLAPAILAFQWTLSGAGKLGWMIAFIYVACAALRLARFNVQIGTTDKKYFIGLASPSAAALVASSVWAFTNLEVDGSSVIYLMLPLVAAAGVLMVSNIKYYSFKSFDIKGRVPFIVVLVIVLLFALVGSAPAYVLLFLFLVYAASGPVQYLYNLKRVQENNN